MVILIGLLLSNCCFMVVMGKDSKAKELGRRERESRQWKEVMILLQKVTEKVRRQMGLAPAHVSNVLDFILARHILCEKQGKINEAYKKLEDV
ncbi:hypothetical protein CsSME_00009248 [Camellia sinensis var. sinensis]